MIRNRIGTLKEQKWFSSLGNELRSLTGDKVTPLARDLAHLAEQVGTGNASPSQLSSLIDRQRDVEDALRDVVDRRTQFGDINQLIRRLKDILSAQQKIKSMPKELLND